MFEKIKKWYEQGLWTEQMVHNAVPKLITEEQYREITQKNEEDSQEASSL